VISKEDLSLNIHIKLKSHLISEYQGIYTFAITMNGKLSNIFAVKEVG